MKNKLLSIIGALTIALILQSCGMERKLAMQFVEAKAKETHVMLVPPDLLYLFNLKALPIGAHNNPDSISYFTSKYVQYVSDSVFLENYFKGFMDKTEEYGLQMYFPDRINEFLEVKTEAYVLRFAQMELTEDTASYLVQEKIKYQNTLKEIIYHTIGLSTWIEVSMKDSSEYFTYFDEQYIADEVLGEFRQEFWSLDVVYDYNTYEIELEDIYNFAYGMGQTHASYLFDLILNSYIWNHLPQENRGGYHYLHYNPTYHSIEVAEEAFIMLEKE